MDLQYYGLTIVILWLLLAGIAAFVGPRLGSWALGRSCGVVSIALFGFVIEHHVGLGTLKGLWILGAFASGYYLWKKWPELRSGGFLKGEIVFALALSFSLLWKYCFPNIYPVADRMSDLYFIGNYMSGTTLPPLDNWFPPYRFDFYSAFQHYAAGLVGRSFDMSPGLTYNVSFAVLMALSLTLAWDTAGRFIEKRWPKILLVAALAIGGTGASVFTHLIYQPPPNSSQVAMADVYDGRMWGSARFIGQYDQLANTAIGKQLFAKLDPDAPGFRQLPMENFGYQYYVGDNHPPIGGFFLLLLAIALITALETRLESQRGSVTLIQKIFLLLTVPATIITHAAVYPLQLTLVGAWVAWRYWRSRHRTEDAPLAKWSLPVAIGVGVAVLALLYPALVGLGTRALVLKLGWVVSHSPPMSFIALMWPLLILLGLAAWSKDMRRYALFFALVLAFLLLISEFFFIADPIAGRYQRTNTVVQWWGWIWTAGLIALGAPLLAAKQKWVRWTTTFALAGTLVYAIDVANYLSLTDERFLGNLGADGVYTQSIPVKTMFRYLHEAPNGIVLENQYAEDYSDGGIYGTFSGKPVLLGWPAHLIGWHPDKAREIAARRDQIRAFYAGTLQKPNDWLRNNNVRYIIWNAHDAQMPEVRQRYREELKSNYEWHVFGGWNNGQPVGIWTRREVF